MHLKSLQCVQRKLAGVDGCSLSLKKSIENFLGFNPQKYKKKNYILIFLKCYLFQISILIKICTVHVCQYFSF